MPLDYLTTDRPVLEAQITARLAEYGAAELRLGPAFDDTEPAVIGNILDLGMVAQELALLKDPAPGSVEEGRAALLIGYLVRRHALGALPVPAGIAPVVLVAGGGGAGVTWDTLPGKPTNFAFLPISTGSISGLQAYVQALIDASPSGVTSHVALTGVQVAAKPGVTVDGGQWHLDGAVKADLLAMLYPYIQPTATLSISPNSLQRRGDTVTVTADGGFSVGSDSASTLGVYQKNGVTFASQSSGIGAPATTTATDTATFSFTVSFPTSGNKTANQTLNFASPVYRGVALPGATDAQVLALAEFVGVHGASLALTFPAGSVGQVDHIAYPASWGLPTMIKDGNGYNVTSAWNVASGSHTGAFTNGAYSDTYRFLHGTVPFAAATAAETLTFFW